MPKTKPLEKWQQTLLSAADYIESHGWCQWTAQKLNGEVCMGGALHSVMGDIHGARARLSTYLGMAVTQWNDKPGRTKTEVITALRSCAALE